MNPDKKLIEILDYCLKYQDMDKLEQLIIILQKKIESQRIFDEVIEGIK